MEKVSDRFTVIIIIIIIIHFICKALFIKESQSATETTLKRITKKEKYICKIRIKTAKRAV